MVQKHRRASEVRRRSQIWASTGFRVILAATKTQPSYRFWGLIILAFAARFWRLSPLAFAPRFPIRKAKWINLPLKRIFCIIHPSLNHFHTFSGWFTSGHAIKDDLRPFENFLQTEGCSSCPETLAGLR